MPTLPRGRTVLAACLGAAVGFLFYVTLRSYYSERGNFRPGPPDPLLHHPELTGIAGLRNISFTSPAGKRIAAWFAPARNSAAVILLHGASADRSTLLPEAQLLARSGFAVLALDLPGQGESQGRILWGEAERAAVCGALDWLAVQPGIDGQRLGAYGFSMGGYTLAQVAAADPRLHAVALAATPTSMIDNAHWEHRRWGLLSELAAELTVRMSGMPFDRPAPVDAIAAIAPRPLLLIGGAADNSVPPAQVRQLYAAAGQPKYLMIVPGAAHGGYQAAAPASYGAGLVGFFTRALLDAPAPAR